MSRYRVWTREFGSEEWAEVENVRLDDNGLVDVRCLPESTYDLRIDLAPGVLPDPPEEENPDA